MRRFKLINVIKETDDNNKANKLLAQGYIEITEDKAVKKPRSRKADSGGDDDGQPDKAQDPAGDPD